MADCWIYSCFGRRSRGWASLAAVTNTANRLQSGRYHLFSSVSVKLPRYPSYYSFIQDSKQLDVSNQRHPEVRSLDSSVLCIDDIHVVFNVTS